MVARDVKLAVLTGARLHVCHVSTTGSLHIIEQAKAAGACVTCEATPHHLTLTDEIVGDYDTNTKVNPPLRSEAHVKALAHALASGQMCIRDRMGPDVLVMRHSLSGAPHYVARNTSMRVKMCIRDRSMCMRK